MHPALRRRLPIGAALGALMLASGSARADEAGSLALLAMDKALNQAKTQYFEFDIINQEPGKPEVRQAITVQQKGDKWLAEFTAPADMKGTKVLVLSPSEIYAYLPAVGKVRRLATNATDQGFMGMAYGLNDLPTHYPGLYTATLLSQTPSQVKIAAIRRHGTQAPYEKIEITINKEHMLPAELRFYRTANQPTKIETRTGYKCDVDVCAAAEQKMVDQSRGGASTRLVRKAWTVNEAMSDDLFSKRSLEK